MATWQQQLEFTLPGRGTRDITAAIQDAVAQSGIGTGLCHVFLRHTSASLMLCENADPQVRDDLERFFARLAPDGDPLFRHDAEGPDDMPAHVRSILTGCDLTLPVRESRLALGTWQGVYLYEHRQGRQQRRIVITVQGE